MTTTTRMINGQEVSEQEFHDRLPSKLDELLSGGETNCAQTSKGWPRESLSLGVHPSQVAEAMEYARKIGIPTEFNPVNGRAIMKDPGHQKRYAGHFGYTDLTERNITSRVQS